MDLGIVIVSYNTCRLTLDCLASVYTALEKCGLDAHVWVIDNASRDDSVPLIRERIKVLSDITAMADFFFIDGHLDYDTDTLLGKAYAGRREAAEDALSRVIAAVDDLEPWTHEAIEGAIRPLAEELGVKPGDLFGLVRVAVTGKTATPPTHSS